MLLRAAELRFSRPGGGPVGIAADDARFGLPEVRRGLIASAGGLYRLPRIVPRVVAMEMITTGRPINAAEALGFGLVNRVVPSHDVLAEAMKLAREVRANAPLAVRESVRIARIASGFDDAVLRSDAEQSQSSLQQTSDYMEGAVAFLEKRAPRWHGR
ncbi:enoyl-CoA hydratase-related protein [uncultured Sphingomonas sp.]|uniref:enoyl-CoA hydratase-related protein n=1 Tax=uncultured Sphingomonas sp. TaxID=158754 RepID=UPI0025DF1817|nr:enoyl-CoA hydratase-related protein [uncultured Sphingomonas sp.]